MNKKCKWIIKTVSVVTFLIFCCIQLFPASITGELKKWHKITITFEGPHASESGNPNPFRDYRLNVTFSKGSRSIVVPGFFAADGNAANTSSTQGNKWRVHFVPDDTGEWTYTASFRQGLEVATSLNASAGSSASFDGESGAFNVGPTDKGGRDFRGKGLLRYVGQHHLQFAQTGEYFLKGGPGSPENLLGYSDFDNTPDKHSYWAHTGDWNNGDPTWQGGKGKGIIGAMNYLADVGMNSVYFLTMNSPQGDGKDVYMWITPYEWQRFDCSKLEQWAIVFDYMTKKGIQLHIMTQEIENDHMLNNGNMGTERKLYYRELVARFACNLAVVWDIGEENNQTTLQRKQIAEFFKNLDPYDHPVMMHTVMIGTMWTVYSPLLGDNNFNGPTMQLWNKNDVHIRTVEWLKNSADNGHKWIVTIDEVGPSGDGLIPDNEDYWHTAYRKEVLWGNLMGGGGGCEYYFGYQHAHHDLNCEDWRSRHHFFEMTRYALEFFQNHIPFNEMHNDDGLATENTWVLVKPGYSYLIYLKNGGTCNVNLGGVSGTFDILWFNPRYGGSLQSGSVSKVNGGAWRNVGSPPNSTSEDWVCLVSKPYVIDPTNTPSPEEGDKLSGTVFGYGDAWSVGCEYDKAFDSDTATYFDCVLASGGYTGIELLSEAEITKIRFHPRTNPRDWSSRMVGGKFQGSTDGSSFIDIYTIKEQPIAGWNERSVSSASFRYLRYISPNDGYCNVAEIEFYGIASSSSTPTPLPPTNTPLPDPTNTPTSGEPIKLTGTVFGNGDAWSVGREYDKAFDSDTATYFDCVLASGGYTGIELLSEAEITKIRFHPRTDPRDWSERMIGGRFQGSANGTDYTDIYTISALPNAGWNEVDLTSSAYKYFRYIGPVDGYCNVAEIEFWGTVGDPISPTNTPVPPTNTPGPGEEVKLSGTVFGYGDAWSVGREYDKVFDGDTGTYFDCALASGGYTGIELLNEAEITKIRFHPRIDPRDWSSRMAGGKFQGSTDGLSFTDIYTIKEQPIAGWNERSVSSASYTYLRYISPIDGYCNVAEIEFYGTSGNLVINHVYLPDVKNDISLIGTEKSLYSITYDKKVSFRSAEKTSNIKVSIYSVNGKLTKNIIKKNAEKAVW
ncbi:DUF5060 domain-containing protein, partial [Spirochaetota bacterium]